MGRKGEASSRGVPRQRRGGGGGRGRQQQQQQQQQQRGESKRDAVSSGKAEIVQSLGKEAVERSDHQSGAQCDENSGARSGENSGAPSGENFGAQAGENFGAQFGENFGAQSGEKSCAQPGENFCVQSGEKSCAQSSEKFCAQSGERFGDGDGSGFRVEEKEEEVGVRSLVRKAASVDCSFLSQSELESNRQAQEDEVLVLESIYGSDFVRVDGSAGAFMINVHLEIPDGIKVAAEARRGCGSSSSEDEDDNCFTVEALPPISLLCVFPATYPSHAAPLFELSCVWLSARKLSLLCTALDALWEATEVVVYTWLDFLRSLALCHVGASEKLQLEELESSTDDLDPRAVSGSESFDVDIFRLLRYNEEVKSKRFLGSLHTCTICYSERPGFAFTRLQCQHHFCRSCMVQYCSMHVKDGTVMNLSCPDHACKESIPAGMLRELLDKEAFERWEDLLLQKTLDSMADVVYCPKCRTPSIEDPDHFVQCSKCRFSFCSLCMSNWHPGQSCMTPDAKLRVLQARRQGRAAGEETLKAEKELINECLDMAYIQKEAKQCPTCRMAVQKSEGCNKMTCLNCGGYFCFQCGQAIRGYDHYRNSSTCVLLDQIEINRWELQFNMELQQLQVQQLVPLNPRGAEGNAAARPCPNCKQVNYKERGNNHMFCWACQNHYCGLCNKMVRRGVAHFGLNKCRQHTAD